MKAQGAVSSGVFHLYSDGKWYLLSRPSDKNFKVNIKFVLILNPDYVMDAQMFKRLIKKIITTLRSFLSQCSAIGTRWYVHQLLA